LRGLSWKEYVISDRLDEAEEAGTIWAQLHNERRTTSEDSDARNG